MNEALSKREHKRRQEFLKQWFLNKKLEWMKSGKTYTQKKAASFWLCSVHTFSKWFRGERRVPERVINHIRGGNRG